MLTYEPVHAESLPKGEREVRGDKTCSWPAKKGTWVAGKNGPFVRCGGEGCKHAFRLSPDVHTIDSNGKVHPSIGCKQCGWHIWGTLEQWEA